MVKVHTRLPKGKMRISSRCIALLLGILLTLGLFFSKGGLGGLRLLAAGDSSNPPREIQFESYDTEISSLDEETTEAPCSLRQAVRRNQHLCKLFNFSVPVLQWARSSSKAAWERPPPYGWRGLPENVVRSTLGLLRVPQLFWRPSPGACIRCAVVGNGGILQGSGQGKDIDSHDFVFRVNGAVIKGFEKDVGTKISFYGFTTNTLKNSLRAYRRNGFTEIPQNPDIKYIFIPSNIRDYVMIAAAIHGQTVDSGYDKGDRPLKYFGHKPPKSFKFLHPDFISYVTRSFLFSPLMTNIKTRHLYMPSTGALMLLTALHTCDEVSAYGFITRNYTAFSDHYYDAVKKPLRFFANHDMRMESRLWEALHLQGVLKLYQRS